MEKGIGAGGAAMYTGSAKRRRYIMDGSERLGGAWAWPSFFDSLVSGSFDPVAGAAERVAGLPPVVTIDAAYVPVPSSGDADVHSLSFPRDIVVLRFSGGSLTPLDTKFEAGLLKGLEKSSTLQNLGERIRRLTDIERIWIDFGAGLRFRTGQDSPVAGMFELWNGPTLWARVVQPWMAWIR
jgi:hypothetical protein